MNLIPLEPRSTFNVINVDPLNALAVHWDTAAAIWPGLLQTKTPCKANTSASLPVCHACSFEGRNIYRDIDKDRRRRKGLARSQIPSYPFA